MSALTPTALPPTSGCTNWRPPHPLPPRGTPRSSGCALPKTLELRRLYWRSTLTGGEPSDVDEAAQVSLNKSILGWDPVAGLIFFPPIYPGPLIYTLPGPIFHFHSRNLQNFWSPVIHRIFLASPSPVMCARPKKGQGSVIWNGGLLFQMN